MFAASDYDHVLDTNHWHFFDNKQIHFELHLPLGLTKYKILLLGVAVLIMLIYIPLARAAQSGKPPRGLLWNAFESLLTFIRDQVARPCLGHDTDQYVHYLWSVFIFILFGNLFGLIPFLGSPTASISVTGALALCTYIFIHGSAVARMGWKHYFESYVPHMDIPYGMGYVIPYVIAVLEFIGNLIKAFVLAVRLFANMFAGHMVLALILLFIVKAAHQPPYVFWGITATSVIGVTLLSLLELFVAFLQAYVFVFLTALFLGSTLHPQH